MLFGQHPSSAQANIMWPWPTCAACIKRQCPHPPEFLSPTHTHLRTRTHTCLEYFAFGPVKLRIWVQSEPNKTKPIKCPCCSCSWSSFCPCFCPAVCLDEIIQQFIQWPTFQIFYLLSVVTDVESVDARFCSMTFNKDTGLFMVLTLTNTEQSLKRKPY